MDARYRFGIEEEFFLADAATRGTPRHTQPFHDAVRARVPTAERELLATQVEVATAPTDSPAAARAQLTELRAGLAEAGRQHGVLVPFAAGLEAVLKKVEEETATLGCEAELAWLRTVAAQGTSADRQLAVFAAARGDARQALCVTVDWIAAASAGALP